MRKRTRKEQEARETEYIIKIENRINKQVKKHIIQNLTFAEAVIKAYQYHNIANEESNYNPSISNPWRIISISEHKYNRKCIN